MDYLKPFGCDVIKQVDTYDLIELCRHIILFCSILFSLKNECDTIIFDRLVEKKNGQFFFSSASSLLIPISAHYDCVPPLLTPNWMKNPQAGLDWAGGKG